MAFIYVKRDNNVVRIDDSNWQIYQNAGYVMSTQAEYEGETGNDGSSGDTGGGDSTPPPPPDGGSGGGSSGSGSGSEDGATMDNPYIPGGKMSDIPRYNGQTPSHVDDDGKYWYAIKAPQVTSANDVDAQYQKYFGRVGNYQEREYWITRPINELTTQLESDYKVASGHDYDGSYIPAGQGVEPGQHKSDKDLNPGDYPDTSGGDTGDTGGTGDTGSSSEMVTLYSPSGQEVSVEKGSDLYNDYINGNFTTSPPSSSGDSDTGSTGDTGTGDTGDSGDTGTGPDIPDNLEGLTPDQINDLIDSFDLPDEQKDFLKLFIGAYEDLDINDEAILDTFNKLEAEIIDPYFNGIIRSFKADFELDLARKAEDFELQQQLDADAAKQRIRGSQQSLEGSGLLRSGESVRELGNISPYQTSLEGRIPTLNRRIAESSQRGYTRGVENTVFGAESYLGSAALAGVDTGNVSLRGGVSGQLPYQREQAKASVLGQLSSQQGALSYYQKQFI